MKERKSNLRILLILIVVALLCSMVFSVLTKLGVIPTKIKIFPVFIMTTFLSCGLIISVFGAINKSGYETALGLGMIIVGATVLLVSFKVNGSIIIIVDVTLALVAIFCLAILNAPKLEIVRTDEEDYKPYTEKLKEEKQKEKDGEKPLPEIKSYKD